MSLLFWGPEAQRHERTNPILDMIAERPEGFETRAERLAMGWRSGRR